MYKVSVFMITYNQEKYIAQAIEGVLNQKANFKIKLFIGEDCSTDSTRSICQDYANKYPDTIELICTKENNIQTNSYNIIDACAKSGADYMAFCEGDDYWIDPYKLQKQADFLDANPDFALCFSAFQLKDDMGSNLTEEKFFKKPEKDILTIEDLILSEVSVIPTATLLIRNILPSPMPRVVVWMSGDIATYILAADKGKAKYMPDKTAVYRHHPTGITKSKENIEKGHDELIKLLIETNKVLNYKYDALFRKRLLSEAKGQLIFGARNKKGMERIKHYFKRMPPYLKYSDKVNVKELAYYHAVLFVPSLLRFFKKQEG